MILKENKVKENTKNIMKNSPNVFIDVDDVIWDTHEALKVKIESLYGYICDVGCVYRLRTMPWYNQILNDLFEEGIPFKDPMVVEHIQKIKKKYKNVHLLTDTFLPMEYFVKLELGKQLGVPVIFTHGNKFLIPRKKDIFIDDRSDYLIQSKAKLKVCMYTPFNYQPEDKGVIVCKNWLDIMEVVT